ncbi:hypothetical protein D3C80_1336570 [compost metagenome]
MNNFIKDAHGDRLQNLTLLHLAAQRGQAGKIMQCAGNAAEKTAGAGQGGGVVIQLHQLALHRQFSLLHFLRPSGQTFTEQCSL